ncbi:MAG: acyl carrier protein [Magnetococcales bacterium]|nr:acyl carrier protein [Magnetococcales bacterium]
MTEPSLLSGVQEALNAVSGQTPGPDEDLFASGALDSTGVVEFVVALENHFDIVFDPEAITMENFATLTTTCREIARLLSADTQG